MRAFLGGAPFVFTGPDRWNALGLGSTGLSSMPLVYNTKRSGTFEFGARRFRLRRVAFPGEDPPAEWFVVDLMDHADEAGVARGDVARALRGALATGRFDRARLETMAGTFGTRETRELIQAALATP